MLADRFRTTAIGFAALAITILIRRLLDSYTISTEIMNIINIATLFATCLTIVIITKAWIPRKAKHSLN